MEAAVQVLQRTSGGDADLLKEWSGRLKKYKRRLEIYKEGGVWREPLNK